MVLRQFPLGAAESLGVVVNGLSLEERVVAEAPVGLLSSVEFAPSGFRLPSIRDVPSRVLESSPSIVARDVHTHISVLVRRRMVVLSSLSIN